MHEKERISLGFHFHLNIHLEYEYLFPNLYSGSRIFKNLLLKKMSFNTGNQTLLVFEMQPRLSIVFKCICKQESQKSLNKLQILYTSVD